MSGPLYNRLSVDQDKEALLSEKLRSSSYSPPRPTSRFSNVPSDFSALSRGSFRSSVSQIPTPGTEEKRPPKFEPFSLRLGVVMTGATIMIIIALALEIALFFSQRDGGFHVPRQNKLPLVSTQFLTSFFPTAMIIPIAFTVTTFDWMMRWWQPYIVLSKGHARAEDGLLLDYIAMNRFLVAYQSMKRKHKIIALSSFTVISSWLWQPLAGSLFSIRQLPESSGFAATSIRTIGLSPDVADLSAFAASAGFAAASVYNDLPDPPFVQGGWAAAEFIFPTEQYFNGTVAVNTTGVQTNVACANPIDLTLSTSNPSQFSVNATSVDGCQLGPVFLNPSDADQQYGVTNVPRCGSTSANITQQPVFFWFYHVKGDGSHEAKGVFCTPSIQLFDIMANADLATGSLVNATKLGNYPTANNVSGDPLNGNAYNGLIFDNSTDVNINARALTIKTEIPGAIFRSATQADDGIDSVFQDVDGFVDRTTQVYTQYLALAAKAVYFVSVTDQVPAVLTELAPRLWITPIPSHLLSVSLIAVGIIIISTHIIHWRSRRDVYLTHAPGSIATVVSQTSRSGFGELLLPYDDQERMRKKLEGLRFRLDKRTGAIVVDDRAIAFGGPSAPSTPDAREQSMMALMGQRHVRMESRESAGSGRGGSTERYSDRPPLTNRSSTPLATVSEYDNERREREGRVEDV